MLTYFATNWLEHIPVQFVFFVVRKDICAILMIVTRRERLFVSCIFFLDYSNTSGTYSLDKIWYRALKESVIFASLWGCFLFICKHFTVKSTAHNAEFKTTQTAFWSPVLWEEARKPQEVGCIAAITSLWVSCGVCYRPKSNPG